jgi:hypothetical protein
MTIHIKRKIVPIKKINKDLERFKTLTQFKQTPPEGWTEEAKAGAKQAAAIGLSLDDLDDGGDMAAELNEIMDLNSDLYK